MKRATSERLGHGRRRRATHEERQRLIQGWQQSQQTPAAFAAEHRLSVATLRNWLRRAHGEGAGEPTQPQFVEGDLGRLVGSEAPPRHGSYGEFEIRLPCGRVVALAPGTSVERVRSVLEAVRC